tara:strand:- start:275 stop:523 length:249 start_codon:yes stop_codon:yes gene_type:complete
MWLLLHLLLPLLVHRLLRRRYKLLGLLPQRRPFGTPACHFYERGEHRVERRLWVLVEELMALVPWKLLRLRQRLQLRLTLRL